MLLVFGEQWREAGNLLVILLPSLVIKFVVSTLSPVFSSTGNNRLGAMWNVMAFLVTLSMFFVCSGRLELEELFFTIMMLDSALYLFYYVLIWVAITRPREFH